ncbi:SIMPL domain-containing protein [Gemmobacter sp.]|uniref:SIMPL domain-containing protein n=1 Tax=Gemmobacter sp. TaxID=1898957 RepID=UPI002AFF1C88|nr:SIMPL domain-containing protein [Gemmobacter sp.]
MRLTKVSMLAAGLASALAVQMAALTALAETAKSRITVTGEGRVDARPDMAVITLGVATQGDTAAAALAENSRRLAAVLAQLKAAGVAERDLQTSGLSLGPRMDYSREGQPPKVVGYEASNMVTVRVRDLTALGGILDKAVGDGANTFHGLSFGLTDATAALDAARVSAVKEAARKAAMMAGAAGVALGPVIEMTESGGAPDPMPMYRKGAVAMAAEAVPVEGGEVSYAVNVTVTWELATP